MLLFSFVLLSWIFFALGRFGAMFFLAVVQDKFGSYFGMSTAVGLNGLYRGFYVLRIKKTIDWQ